MDARAISTAGRYRSAVKSEQELGMLKYPAMVFISLSGFFYIHAASSIRNIIYTDLVGTGNKQSFSRVYRRKTLLVLTCLSC